MCVHASSSFVIVHVFTGLEIWQVAKAPPATFFSMLVLYLWLSGSQLICSFFLKESQKQEDSC